MINIMKRSCYLIIMSAGVAILPTILCAKQTHYGQSQQNISSYMFKQFQINNEASVSFFNPTISKPTKFPMPNASNLPAPMQNPLVTPGRANNVAPATEVSSSPGFLGIPLPSNGDLPADANISSPSFLGMPGAAPHSGDFTHNGPNSNNLAPDFNNLLPNDGMNQ